MNQSTFLVGTLIAGFGAWTIYRGTFGNYLSLLGLGGIKPAGSSGGAGASSGGTPQMNVINGAGGVSLTDQTTPSTAGIWGAILGIGGNANNTAGIGPMDQVSQTPGMGTGPMYPGSAGAGP